MSRRVFALPDLGEGLTEAELVRWLVQVGDAITIDTPIAEVETAKAVVEVPSPFQGVIADLHGAEGSTIQVGAPLISVEEKLVPAIEERAGSGNVLIGYGTPVDSDTGRRQYAVGSLPSGARPPPPRPLPSRPSPLRLCGSWHGISTSTSRLSPAAGRTG